MVSRAPPTHIQRQRPIEGTVEVNPLTHNREFHGLGLAGRVLRFEYRLVSKSALDRLDKLYQHRLTSFVVQLICLFCCTSYVSFVDHSSHIGYHLYKSL